MDGPDLASEHVDLPDFTVVAVTWDEDSLEVATEWTIDVSLREDSGWSEWNTLSVNDALGPKELDGSMRQGTDPLFTESADGVRVRVDTPDGSVPTGLEVTTIDPGSVPEDASMEATPIPTQSDLAPEAGGEPTEVQENDSLSSLSRSSASAAGTADAGPEIIMRDEWGADESLRTDLLGWNETVKSIVVHHTASTSNYSRSQAAQQLRGIYAYHADTLGWGDIGYHFVVDRYGRIYEGRAGALTSSVKGAHAAGNNTATMGVSALGNYDTTSAPDGMVRAIGEVSGWKLSQYGRNPKGTVTQRVGSNTDSGSKFNPRREVTLKTINGHRDTYKTACPGRYLVQRMGNIRNIAASRASNNPGLPAAEPLFEAYGDKVLRNGDRGRAVQAMQNALNNSGHSVGAVDGVWGPNTSAGLASFQRAEGLPRQDQVNTDDWRLLSGLPPVGRSLADRFGSVNAERGDRGPEVRAIQSVLNYMGFDAGAVDGSWGPSTSAAVEDFHWAFELRADDNFTRNDWEALAGMKYSQNGSDRLTRIGGANRYKVAASLSASVAPGGTVYVAAGGAYADAMTASASAGHSGSAVLLVKRRELPPVTAEALERLRPERIVVMGGWASVSGGTLDELRAYADQVQRFGGENRYQVAARLSEESTSESETVYITAGDAFADAMTASAVAANSGAPVLLTKPQEVPPVTEESLDRLDPRRVVVVGGEASVSPEVVENLDAQVSRVDRVGGANRYQVAARLARSLGSGPQEAFVAGGSAFADAMTASAIAGAAGAPVLLTKPDNPPRATQSALERVQPSRIVVVGGPVSVHPPAMGALRHGLR